MKLTTLILLLACRVMGQTNDVDRVPVMENGKVPYWMPKHDHLRDELQAMGITNNRWLYDTNYAGGLATWKANTPGFETNHIYVTQTNFLYNTETNYLPFCSFRNRDYVHHLGWYGDYIEWKSATNVELLTSQEPIVTKTTNGWVIHFKP